MTEKEFRKLKLEERYHLLRTSGKYIGARRSEGHFVYLYGVEGMYVELYMRAGLNCVSYIELQKSKLILDEYVKQVNLPNDLFKR